MNLLQRLRAPHNDAGAGSPEPPVRAVEDRHSVEIATSAPASPSTRLRAEADRRVHDAITEGLDQLNNGWRPAEVLAVLADAAAIVADLREQADEADDLEDHIRDHDELTVARVRGFGWVEDLGRVS